MFNRHLFRVIGGFCGMILLGLISLVVIDSFKTKEEPFRQLEKSTTPTTVTLPPIKTTPQTTEANVKVKVQR